MSHAYCKNGRIDNMTRNFQTEKSEWSNQESLRHSI